MEAMKALYLGVVELQQFFLHNLSCKLHSRLSWIKNSKIKLFLANFLRQRSIFFLYPHGLSVNFLFLALFLCEIY